MLVQKSVFMSSLDVNAVIVVIDQHLHQFDVYLFHIKLSLHKPIRVHSFTCKGHGQNFIGIENVVLMGTNFSDYIVNITLDTCKTNSQKMYTQDPAGNTIKISDSHFSNISGGGVIIYVQIDNSASVSYIYIHYKL